MFFIFSFKTNKKVDPKFLRNLKFSKKHNVRNPKPAGERVAKVVKAPRPAPVKAAPVKAAPAKAVAAPAKAAAAAKPQKK